MFTFGLKFDPGFQFSGLISYTTESFVSRNTFSAIFGHFSTGMPQIQSYTVFLLPVQFVTFPRTVNAVYYLTTNFGGMGLVIFF